MRRIPLWVVGVVQLGVVAAFGGAWLAVRAEAGPQLQELVRGRRPVIEVPVPRQLPLRIAPLYNRPELVSDADLRAVLKQVRPKFPAQKLKPNFVEHALRIWGVDATFHDPDVMSGEELKDFLVNHGKYLASWGEAMKDRPLLLDDSEGVHIRWGREEGASVHHDHWLACLTEAGIKLEEPVFTPSGRRTIADVLQQSLRDFQVDEREVEWSALAFGLWIAPTHEWRTNDGRRVTFDILARRLIRGAPQLGVCEGTHRLYSLMALVRLDDDHDILSDAVRAEIMAHLHAMKKQIIASQFEDGHWPTNWPDGADAVKTPLDDPLYKKVIATGHHLEWLAIAPEELHPPREQIEKAVRWVVQTTTEKSEAEILQFYTFFSHVGGALALWRQTRPADFWREQEHLVE